MASRKLTDVEREDVWREYMRELSRTRTVVGAINKFELRARLDALDDDLATGKTTTLDLPAPVEANFKTRAAYLANIDKHAAIVTRATAALEMKRNPPAPVVTEQRKGALDGIR